MVAVSALNSVFLAFQIYNMIKLQANHYFISNYDVISLNFS